MLPQEPMVISVVLAAARGHIDVHGLGHCLRIFWGPMVLLQSGRLLMSMAMLSLKIRKMSLVYAAV